MTVCDPIMEMHDKGRLETAPAEDHESFRAKGPRIDNRMLQITKRILSRTGLYPIVIRSGDDEAQARFLEELVRFAGAEGHPFEVIDAGELDRMSFARVEVLWEKWVFVTGFASLLLEEKGEENLLLLRCGAERLVLFTSPGDGLAFMGELLNRQFDEYFDVDIDEEEEACAEDDTCP